MRVRVEAFASFKEVIDWFYCEIVSIERYAPGVLKVMYRVKQNRSLTDDGQLAIMAFESD